MQPDFPAVTDIVDRVRNGNQLAERMLCERFLPRVKCMLRVRLRDDEAVAEVANDVLLAVIKAMREGRLRDAEALPAFVHGVARNLANNYVRSRLDRRNEQPLSSDFDHPAPPHDASQEERLEAARQALDQLEEPDRTILLLVLVEGLKPGEIGRRLALSAEVVRARKSRAVKRIIAQLGTRSEQ